MADHFFQAAFGGSFLNHQWLIAARTPLDTSHGARAGAANSVLDTNGMPTSYPLYTADRRRSTDGQLTRKCDDPAADERTRSACGDFAVNTVQPSSPPARRPARKIPLIDDAKYPNIGDRLTEAGHLLELVLRRLGRRRRPGTRARCSSTTTSRSTTSPTTPPAQPGRAHLKDETKFIAAAKNGHLPTVCFVKPYGAENEHPGYASEPNGCDHLVDLLKTITNGPAGRGTRWSW